jgi:hypothetical protein
MNVFLPCDLISRVLKKIPLAEESDSRKQKILSEREDWGEAEPGRRPKLFEYQEFEINFSLSESQMFKRLLRSDRTQYVIDKNAQVVPAGMLWADFEDEMDELERESAFYVDKSHRIGQVLPKLVVPLATEKIVKETISPEVVVNAMPKPSISSDFNLDRLRAPIRVVKSTTRLPGSLLPVGSNSKTTQTGKVSQVSSKSGRATQFQEGKGKLKSSKE